MRRRADMRCRERALAALLAGLIAVCASLGARAAGPDAEEAGATAAPRRLVAVGDVHGELDGLRAILRESGLLGEAGGWSGGAAVLVQTGDLLDRGAAVREVMDLLMGLQEAAAAGGGEVLVLAGNHESMNLLRVLRDVGPEAFAAFADEGSDARRRAAFEQWQRWLGVHLERLGEEALAVAPVSEEQWLAAHPPGRLAYLQALGAAGVYGRWLRSLAVAVRVERTLLLHAGLSTAYADLSVDEVNRRHADAVARFDVAWHRLEELGVLLPSFDRNQGFTVLELYAGRDPAAPALPPEVEEAVAEGTAAFDGIRWVFEAESPLWYRGFTELADGELRQLLERLQETHDVDRVVAAHTPRRDARIGWRLGGLLYLVDTGMLSSHYRGRPAALEIVGPRVTAIYSDRRDLLAADPGAAEGALTYAIPRRVWLDAEKRPLPFQTAEEATEFLRSARIVETVAIGVGVSKPRRALLEQGGVRAHASMHDIDVERERVRLGDTFHMHFLDSYRSQVAAYELGRLLGMDSIPPTVARTVAGKQVSLQLWIEASITEEQRLADGRSLGPRAYYLHQYWDRAIFHNLVDDHDVNQGNLLWNEDGTVWLIDHTRSFARSRQLRDPGRVVRCSRPLYQALRELQPEAVQERLSPLLGHYEIRALLERRDKILEILDERIERLGEEKVLFDYGERVPEVVVTYEEDEAA
jgi:hypothetical protein